jgi:hypothetical protein
MTQIGDRLITNARRAGAIRPEVTGADVFALMNAAAWTREHTSPRQAERLLTFTLETALSTIHIGPVVARRSRRPVHRRIRPDALAVRTT